MAIRSPSRYTERWYYDDVLEYEVTEFPDGFAVYDPDEYYPMYTYVEDFPLVTQGFLSGFYSKEADTAVPTQFRSLKIKLFDEPPETKQELFNNDVASIDYEVEIVGKGLGSGKLVTIVGWQHTWRDEWPIRLGLNYLTNCLFRPSFNGGTVFRVLKDPIAFWQSERFVPLGGHDDPYIVRTPQWIP
jgi:hypothetical protein